MHVRENRFGNFVVIQLFDSEEIPPQSLLDIRLELNFNKVRIAIAHATETVFQRPIVYLTPSKPYNRNAYVVVLGTRAGLRPVYLRFKHTPEGIDVDPAEVLIPEQTVGHAYAQLLMGEKSDGTHAFGVPGGFELPVFLAIQLVLGDDQFKFMVGIAEQDVSLDPRPFRELLASLKRPPGPIKKRRKLARIIKISSSKT
jgi:hypothetical protein